MIFSLLLKMDSLVCVINYKNCSSIHIKCLVAAAQKAKGSRLSMLDGTSVLQVNLPLVGTINSQSNKFVMGVKIKATGNSKLSDSPAYSDFRIQLELFENFSLEYFYQYSFT